MSEKLTFEQLLDLEWKYSSNNDREDYHLKVFDSSKEESWDKDLGTLVNFEQSWADHEPVSHSFNKEVNDKVANLFLYSKEMYKLISSIDTEEARELIQKINEASVSFVGEEDEDE